jgi:hypothetical protein
MSERAAYSRVYWSIVDDPKFETIYDNDAHLAAWLRLLLIADQAHPASAHLPASVRRSSVAALAAAGLIDVSGSRYRVHGLDAERAKRASFASHSGPRRDPDGTQTGPERDRTGIQTQGLRRDETRRDKTRESARENDPYADPEMEAVQWLAKHGCDIRPGNGYHRQLVTAVERHGATAVVGMLDRLSAAGVRNGDTKGFLFGAIDALDGQSRPDLRVIEKEERVAEQEAAFNNRVTRTKRRMHENGQHTEPVHGCPLCVTVKS